MSVLPPIAEVPASRFVQTASVLMTNNFQTGGGEVAGVVVFANAGRSGVLTPRRQDVKRIEGRFGDVIRNEFQIDPAALTADEAAYLSNFRDADQLRASIAKCLFKNVDAVPIGVT
jgi:hypothetical protein